MSDAPSLVHTAFECSDDLAIVTLTDADRRNPTSIASLDALDAALDDVEARRARVVLLAGAGRAFCAGLDLDEVRADDATVHRLLIRLGEVMRRLRRLDAVTVACVQGAAIGGGFGFLAACDFSITHPEAKIGYPPLATGLSPALMAPWLMRKIGPSPARALLLAGGTISGADAHARGIVTDCVERDSIDATARTLAERLLTSPPAAQRAMKQFLNELDGSLDDTWLDRAAETSATVIASAESRAALTAVLDRA